MTPNELCIALQNNFSALFECVEAPQEGVLIHTPFMYPDGGIVDVFVIERNGQYIITDHGDALGWLSIQSVQDNLSPEQWSLVNDICRTLGVELNRGRLVLRCETITEMGESVHLVGQAAVRVSDVWFTLHLQPTETVHRDTVSALSRQSETVEVVYERVPSRQGSYRRDANVVKREVANWLAERKMPFRANSQEVGISGRKWRMDYRIDTEVQTSLVSVLSAGSRSGAYRVTERAIARCVDLNPLKERQPELAFVSLFDDTQEVWLGEDFKMVSGLSEIALWSRPEQFAEILKAV